MHITQVYYFVMDGNSQVKPTTRVPGPNTAQIVSQLSQITSPAGTKYSVFTQTAVSVVSLSKTFNLMVTGEVIPDNYAEIVTKIMDAWKAVRSCKCS